MLLDIDHKVPPSSFLFIFSPLCLLCNMKHYIGIYEVVSIFLQLCSLILVMLYFNESFEARLTSGSGLQVSFSLSSPKTLPSPHSRSTQGRGSIWPVASSFFWPVLWVSILVPFHLGLVPVRTLLNVRKAGWIYERLYLGQLLEKTYYTINVNFFG